MAKANKILRDIDKEYGYKLECSDLIGLWATNHPADYTVFDLDTDQSED